MLGEALPCLGPLPLLQNHLGVGVGPAWGEPTFSQLHPDRSLPTPQPLRGHGSPTHQLWREQSVPLTDAGSGLTWALSCEEAQEGPRWDTVLLEWAPG